MRKGQEMSIEVLVVMALALLLVTIWYFGQGAMGDAIKKNLEEGKCISAVNIAVIASAGHEEGTVEATWYKTITELVTSSFTVKRADLEYEGLCCVELEEDKSKRAKKDTLILISQKVNTTCSLGRRLKDTSMLDESTPFCFISKLPVLPDADISKGELSALDALGCITDADIDLEKDTEANLRFSFIEGVSTNTVSITEATT